MVVYSRFNCEVLSPLSFVLCLGMVLYWYFEPQQSQMRVFLIHCRHLSGRVQCSHRATTVMWTTMSSGNPVYHERHLSDRVQCSHRTTTDDINHETRQLLGNLSHHFDNNAFRSRETLNIKYYISNSGIWGPIRHLPLRNNKFLSYFKIEETTKNLNQVGRSQDLNPGPPECESRALPRSYLDR